MFDDLVEESEPAEDDGEGVAVAPDGFRLTDAGNAERFIAMTGGEVRFVHQWARWIVFREGRWIVDVGDALVTEKAKAVPRSLMAMIPNLSGDERDRVFKAAVRAESAGALAGLIRLARGIPGVLVDHEQLDADPLILNCRNGTVNLETGVLGPHDPDDLCIQQCPVDYEPAAVAPLWEACLERWQPDPDVRSYLQREAGAGACGRQTETLSIHYGQGGNGKSKFFEAVQRVLGPYAVVPHKSLIVANRHEQHATVLASLFRVRLAVASETSVTDRLNDEQVKNLTGNDRLRARRMREDEWSFDPSHTLAMCSNHLPTIRGTDEAIWRRVRLIPWDVTIPEAERDEALGVKLAAEARGILAWIVAGSRQYLADGIGAPEQILARTAAYRTAEDTVARFIRDTLDIDPDGGVASSELMEAHDEWCSDNGLQASGHWKWVTSELTRRGAKAKRSKSVRYWVGITLQNGEVGTGVTGMTPLPVIGGFAPRMEPTGTAVTRVTPAMESTT
jgi:putative DNA primase/helicase